MISRLGGAGWFMYALVIGTWALVFGPVIASAVTLHQNGSRRHREEKRLREDPRTAEIPVVNTATSELSYLVTSAQIEQIPLNGRNYTDLMSLLPAVTPFPHRDNGSVVAHGLAMSVNGQDPRANVYLLDGTLTNDFTNGPAGSAAPTASRSGSTSM